MLSGYQKPGSASVIVGNTACGCLAAVADHGGLLYVLTFGRRVRITQLVCTWNQLQTSLAVRSGGHRMKTLVKRPPRFC